MDYYINPIWFYLMQISDCLNVVGFIFAVLFVGIAAILYYVGTDSYDDNEYDKDTIIKRSKKFMIAAIIFFILAILCPSEKTCTRMMVVATVNKENVASVKEEIYDIVDYIDEKLDDKE